MDPWYKVATPRKEVREGRSFNRYEFAIVPDQMGTRMGRNFLRLAANALSALYPKDSEEKRLLDAMLLVVPR